jgi:hypothetical protein
MKPISYKYSDKPDRQSGIELHRRLLAADPVAPADIALAYLMPVIAALKVKYPFTDYNLLSDSATEAFLNYVVRPSSFDPARRGLFGYLKMSAEGDLKNALAKQKLEQARLVSLESFVELSGSFRNNPIEEEFIDRQAAKERILTWQDRQAVDLEQAANSELDRQLLELLMEGERRTQAYARILEIEHLSFAQQRQIVKRHKDRLRVRLKRRQAQAG